MESSEMSFVLINILIRVFLIGLGVVLTIGLITYFYNKYKDGTAQLLPNKRPWFCWLPKFKTTVNLPSTIVNYADPLQSLGDKLQELGFRLEYQETGFARFTRGSKYGDFSTKIMKIDLTFSTPIKQETDVIVEYGEFAAFDTGDLWKLTTEVKQHLQN